MPDAQLIELASKHAWTARHNETGMTCRINYRDVVSRMVKAHSSHLLRQDADSLTVGSWTFLRSVAP